MHFEEELRKHVDKQQQRQKVHFDERHAVKETAFSEGQHVYVKRDVRPDKSTPKWTAPQKISKPVGRSSVELEDGSLRVFADIAPAPEESTTQ